MIKLDIQIGKSLHVTVFLQFTDDQIILDEIIDYMNHMIGKLILDYIQSLTPWIIARRNNKLSTNQRVPVSEEDFN